MCHIQVDTIYNRKECADSDMRRSERERERVNDQLKAQRRFVKSILSNRKLYTRM